MSSPVRLAKKKTVSEKIDDFAMKYAYILFPLSLMILAALFVILCYTICGVSATDSGVQYNHLQDVI